MELNTLGCSRCRPAHHDALREFFASRQSELCNTCKRKYRNHPTWTLSCPETSCTNLANLAPTMLGYLCQDCKFHFNQLKYFIKELQLDVHFNPRVVRDVEYYTRTVFRIVAGGRTIGCGGRYDGLFQHLGGADTPATGVAFYLDEIAALLPAPEGSSEEVEVVFVPEGDEAIRMLLPVCQHLRRYGVRVEMAYDDAHLPPARYVVRLPERETSRGTVDVKDLDRGSTEKVAPDKLTIRLLNILGLAEESGGGRGMRRRLQRSRRDTPAPAYAERPAARMPARAPAEAASEEMEDRLLPEEGAETTEDATGRRRKRRRRRRGEGPSEVSVEALNGSVAESRDEEEEVEAPQRREPAERTPARNGGPSRFARGQRGGRPAQAAERGERSEPAQERERADTGRGGGGRGGRPERVPVATGSPEGGGAQGPRGDRGPRDHRPPVAPPRPEVRREEPAKAFIPALILGGAPAVQLPKVSPSDDGRAVAQPKAALPLPASPPPVAAGGLALNWSVSLKPKSGEDSAEPAVAERDDQEGAGYRRPRRRR